MNISVGSSIVPCSAIVRDLDVLLDSELFVKQHISNVTSTCYYHLRRLHQIHNYISCETMIQLVMSLVISHIDYCNSVLVGFLASTLAPLQRVQNAATWIILGLSRRSHITHSLKQLLWLPIKFYIIFKVASTMHSIFHQRSPPYLKESSTKVISSQVNDCTSNKNSVRSFALLVCRPDIWNNLPVNIRLTDSPAAF